MPILNEFLSDHISLESIFDKYPDEEFLTANGFDEAILGVDDTRLVVVYSSKKIIQCLIKNEEMNYEEAMEYFDYNIKCAYMGEKTPLFIDDIF